MTPATALRYLGYWCRLQRLFGADLPGEVALRTFLRPPKPRIMPKQATFLAEAQRSTFDFESTVIAHDPRDGVTDYCNALRLVSRWPNSLIYLSTGAGHGFADANPSEVVLAWLLQDVVPLVAIHHDPTTIPQPSASRRSGSTRASARRTLRLGPEWRA